MGNLSTKKRVINLKNSYLRHQISYTYHIKKTSDHDFVNNHFITFNPEYFFRLKNNFEFGMGVNLGVLKQGFRLPISGGRTNYGSGSFISGLTTTGMYNFGRFFSSITANYNLIIEPMLISGNGNSKNSQFLFRLGYRL